MNENLHAHRVCVVTARRTPAGMEAHPIRLEAEVRREAERALKALARQRFGRRFRRLGPLTLTPCLGSLGPLAPILGASEPEGILVTADAWVSSAASR